MTENERYQKWTLMIQEIAEKPVGWGGMISKLIREFEEIITEKDSEIEFLTEERDEAIVDIDNADERIEELEDQLADAQSEVENKSDEIDELKNEVDELKIENERLSELITS